MAGASAVRAALTDDPGTLEVRGRQFRARTLDALTLLEFAAAADDGLDTDDLAGLAAVYRLLRGCIDPADWRGFAAWCKSESVGAEELMRVVQTVISGQTGRPTPPLPPSPDGPSSVGITSSPGSVATARSGIAVDV